MDGHIRPASKQDIPALCKIWKQCFDDGEEYIRCFYDENFERITVLTYFVDETPVSMVNLLDSTLTDGVKTQDAKFIFATGTLPEHRGKGYMAKLMQYIVKAADDSDFALFLKPSNTGLVEYYKKFGLVPVASLYAVNVTPNEAQNISETSISYEEYNRMRNARFSKTPFSKWQNEHLRWCAIENEIYHGKMLKIELDGEEYFLMGYQSDGVLIIDETDLTRSQIEELSGALCRLFSAKQIKAYLGNFACDDSSEPVCILLYNSHINNPYINMIMI